MLIKGIFRDSLLKKGIYREVEVVEYVFGVRKILPSETCLLACRDLKKEEWEALKSEFKDGDRVTIQIEEED